ncbi:MAG TPA: serine hydrolase domain-containing protein [Ignavibacteriales bacterium]|nr:serine hydrolase domain-containing protein [Ignavibacteriales bacterium]
MQTTRSVLLLILLAFSTAVPQKLSKSNRVYIDSIMNASYKPGEPGAVVLVARNGQVLFRKGYGMASLELNVKQRPEFLFPLGSIVKQFTAVGTLKLCQEGKLSLQDDVRKFIPDYNTHGRIITIENLLTHTSGIMSLYEMPDYMKLRRNDFLPDEVRKLFQDKELYFEPGMDWNYSNSGFTLLGIIIEKVSGMSHSDFLKTNIFTPLNMTRTFIASGDKVIPGLVPYYKAAGKGNYKPGPYFSFTSLFAAGDIISCCDDMLKWDEALYTEKILKKEWLSKAWTSYILPDKENTNYGFGWALGEYKGMHFIQHDGIAGYLSDAIRVPEKHLYVFIASNNGSKNPNDAANKIALRLLGLSIKNTPVKMDAEALEEYKGTFEVRRPAGNDFRYASKEKVLRSISLSGDSLFSECKAEGRYRLIPVEKDVFLFEATDTKMQYQRDEKGRIKGIRIYSEPVNYGPDDIEPVSKVTVSAER